MGSVDGTPARLGRHWGQPLFCAPVPDAVCEDAGWRRSPSSSSPAGAIAWATSIPGPHGGHAALHLRDHRDHHRPALEAHVHADEDDAFYILEGELTFTLGRRRWSRRPGRSSSCRPGWTRLPQRHRAAGADAQPPRAGRLRPPGSGSSTDGRGEGPVPLTRRAPPALVGGDGLDQPRVVALVLVRVGRRRTRRSPRRRPPLPR